MLGKLTWIFLLVWKACGEFPIVEVEGERVLLRVCSADPVMDKKSPKIQTLFMTTPFILGRKNYKINSSLSYTTCFKGQQMSLI